MLARSSASREVVIVLAATFLMIGAFDVLAVVLAIGSLGIGGSGAGYLTAMHGAGAVVGALASFALVGRARLVPVLIGAALLAAIAFLLLGIETSILVVFVVAAVSGISRSLLEVTGQTLLQRVTATALLARVFAFKEGLTMAACGLGSVIVPLVIADRRCAWGAVRDRRDRARHRPAAPAAAPEGRCRGRGPRRRDRPAQVPAGLPRAPRPGARRHRAVGKHNHTVPAGAAIVRQGEPGDRYYAIADGTVEVIKDGRLVATLGRGEGFGEIALLHSVTRTATVVAVTAATLTAIEREPFLVAVTGHSQTQERLEHVASDRLRR